MAELIHPTTAVHESYRAAVEEYRAEGRFPDFDDLDVDRVDAFARHVAAVRASRSPMIFWWVNGPVYLGRLSVWPTLTTQVPEVGQVGYDVRPSARGRGHATAMLTAALPVLNRMGVHPAVLTVRRHNVASRRVIEANGGVLVGQESDRLRFHLPAR